MLTRAFLEGWLIRREHSHLLKCGWSAVADGANVDLNDVFWDALRYLGRRPFPADPSSISDSDLAVVTDSVQDAFLLALRYQFLLRVLSHYRSQATQAVGNTSRIEFSRRADGLAEDLFGDDGKGGLKAEVEEGLESVGGGNVLVGERLRGTNVPDAACTPFRLN